MLKAIRERPSLQGLILISPTMFWLTAFLLIPLVLIVVISVGARGSYGNVEYTFRLDNYARLLDKDYAGILWDSTWIALLTTVACLLGGYPLAYFITRSHPMRRSFFMFLILVPFWTNFLIRIYAWMIILRGEGVLNAVMTWLGLMGTGFGQWLFEQVQLYTPGAVLVGMVYEFIPFMILPLYTSL
jgi:spermidine/putrescine transport system permease protein